jgi:hypothetical protein
LQFSELGTDIKKKRKSITKPTSVDLVAEQSVHGAASTVTTGQLLFNKVLVTVPCDEPADLLCDKPTDIQSLDDIVLTVPRDKPTDQLCETPTDMQSLDDIVLIVPRDEPTDQLCDEPTDMQSLDDIVLTVPRDEPTEICDEPTDVQSLDDIVLTVPRDEPTDQLSMDDMLFVNKPAGTSVVFVTQDRQPCHGMGTVTYDNDDKSVQDNQGLLLLNS